MLNNIWYEVSISIMSNGGTGTNRKNKYKKVKGNILVTFIKFNWELDSSGERNSVSL